MRRRMFVTVTGNDGVVLVNKLMVFCENEKQAIRAGKQAVMSSNIRFDNPTNIAWFLMSLTIKVEG